MSMTDELSDRLAELKTFDETKKGVKGLVDAGITTIPSIFRHEKIDKTEENGDYVVPVISLEGIHSSSTREKVVDEVSRACREIGFFVVVNHGIPNKVTEGVISSIRAFHELPGDEKAQYYTRSGKEKGVSYLSNVDLYTSNAASWRDTIQIGMIPNWPHMKNIPEICRNEVVESDEYFSKLTVLLLELMAEGLGLEFRRLTQMNCTENKTMAAHYYPWCPQPGLTVGLTPHTDPGILTLLLQDQIGGLQVKCGEKWVEIKPIPGAIVVNIGDIMQMLSNDEYLSGLHRVVANRCKEARVAVAVFFNPADREAPLEPFPELVSPVKPQIYKRFNLSEYYKLFMNRELGDKSVKEQFKIRSE